MAETRRSNVTERILDRRSDIKVDVEVFEARREAAEARREAAEARREAAETRRMVEERLLELRRR